MKLVQGIFRRIVSILQRMIDCRQVTEGTDAYESTKAALHLARSMTDDGAVYTRQSRNVRGHRLYFFYYMIVIIVNLYVYNMV